MTHVDKFSSFAHMMLMFYTKKNSFFFEAFNVWCKMVVAIVFYIIRDYKTVRCNELNAGKEEDINGR